MKDCYSVKWILTLALMLPGLTACSFFGDDEEAAPEVAASGEEGSAEATEANAEENAGADATAAEMPTEESPMPPDDQAMAAADAAAGDASGPAASSDIPAELLGNADASAMPPAPAADAMAPTMAATSEMAPPAPAAAPAPNFSAAPGDARVYYVNVAALPLRDRPDGQSVGNLMMGDPVLVKIEGNWANILNRGWVELASLSMSPVGRNIASKSWN